jgi:hypothetical protein
MTLEQFGTHSLAFLLGAMTGAAGQYLADKYTDQRRRQEAAATVNSEWLRLTAKMPALFAEMNADLKGNALVREFFVLPNVNVSLGGSSQPRFTYYESTHPNLRAMLGILEEAGYIRDVTVSNVPIYRMSETFIDMLGRDS